MIVNPFEIRVFYLTNGSSAEFYEKTQARSRTNKRSHRGGGEVRGGARRGGVRGHGFPGGQDPLHLPALGARQEDRAHAGGAGLPAVHAAPARALVFAPAAQGPQAPGMTQWPVSSPVSAGSAWKLAKNRLWPSSSAASAAGRRLRRRRR